MESFSRISNNETSYIVNSTVHHSGQTMATQHHWPSISTLAFHDELPNTTSDIHCLTTNTLAPAVGKMLSIQPFLLISVAECISLCLLEETVDIHLLFPWPFYITQSIPMLRWPLGVIQLPVFLGSSQEVLLLLLMRKRVGMCDTCVWNKRLDTFVNYGSHYPAQWFTSTDQSRN